jgi:hypothetical protein
MTLTQVCRVISSVPEDSGERFNPPIQRDAVVPGAMQGRQTTGENGGTIWHADRIRYMGTIKSDGSSREVIKVGRLDHIAATEARVIRPVLIGHDNQNIGLFSHV